MARHAVGVAQFENGTVNATTTEPMDEKATKTGWTNDYAAKAIATMKK